jgi:hypothetical protein
VPSAGQPGGSNIPGKPGSSKTRGLPVAKAIDDAAKTKALETLAAMAGDPLAGTGLQGNPLQIQPPKSSPQWLWWSVAIGATILMVLIVILVVSQLN